MKFGIAAAVTWALDTVILSIALSCTIMASTPEIIALASFISTFMHDAFAAIYMFIYMAIRRKLGKTWKLLRSKAGVFVIIAAVIGAPLGMSGYMMAINNIGATYATAITAFFPAFGTLLCHIFLKHGFKPYQWAGLIVCIIAVVILGYTPADGIPGDWFLGLLGCAITIVGWGTEAVIIEGTLTGYDVDDECALQIRETTSAVVYACIVLPLIGGWAPTITVIGSEACPWILLAALLGIISYIVYYKAIDRIGAAKSMALNITYSAWAIPFSLILLGSMPDAKGIICAIVIIVGAIVAAVDVKDLFGKGDKDEPEQIEAAA